MGGEALAHGMRCPRLSPICSWLRHRTSPSIRFPSGDKGQVRGLDGVLVSVSEVEGLNVPQGKSYWETSTEEDYKGKALRDFKKRTGEVSAAEQADITFVIVSPWTWDSSDPKNKLEDWLAACKSNSSWKDVRYIDGSALETWLEQRPAVAALHARRTLAVKPQEGVWSTDEYGRISLASSIQCD